MEVVFYMASAIAVVSSLLAITRLSAVHSLLYLLVAILALSLIFFTLGAPFVAALQTIIYGGAIMVLFIFVIMMLNQGPATVEQERQWLSPGVWVAPSILALILACLMLYILTGETGWIPGNEAIEPKELSLVLYGKYWLAVELVSVLLLAGLVGAYHLGRKHQPDAKKDARP